MIFPITLYKNTDQRSQTDRSYDCNYFAFLQTLFFLLLIPGVLLFYWLMACRIVRILTEGMTCLQIFRQQKLAISFQDNTLFLNKLIECVELVIGRR